MKVGIYTRVSTDEQVKKGFSLGDQKDECLRYIHLQGWELYNHYCDDGYSGKDLNRPGIKQAIRDIEAKKIDIVIFFSLDRLTRSIRDLHYLLDLFEQYKIDFISIKERFDTSTPAGRLHMNQMIALYQWERENIADRMMRGKEAKARQGGRVGAPLPFGYKYDDQGKIVTDPISAPIVKRLFDLYQKKGMFTIAKIFNREGVPSLSNTRWSMPGIKHILENPFYAGVIQFNRQNRNKETIVAQGNHPAIISKELFEKTKQLMSKRINNKGALTSDYPFSGVLRCAKCGGAMTGTKFTRGRNGKKKTYYYYHCNSRRLGTCDIPQVSERKLEEQFFKYKIPLKDENYRPEEEERDTENMVSEIQNQLKKIKDTKKRWQLAYGEGVIDLDEFRDLSKMIKEREQRLFKQLEEIQVDQEQKPVYNYNDFIAQLEQIRVFWSNMKRHEKKEFISLLVKKIVINVKDQPPGRDGRDCKIVEIALN
jgi:site-specific DNA recombinase